jgi:hypothetical protein
MTPQNRICSEFKVLTSVTEESLVYAPPSQSVAATGMEVHQILIEYDFGAAVVRCPIEQPMVRLLIFQPSIWHNGIHPMSHYEPPDQINTFDIM